MQLNLKSISMEPRPFEFKRIKKVSEGDAVREIEEIATLQIRPFPRIKQDAKFKVDGQILLTGEDQFDRFSYCLTGWDVTDPADAPIKLTDDVKKAVFNANWEGIADFVLQKSREIESAREASEKN